MIRRFFASASIAAALGAFAVSGAGSPALASDAAGQNISNTATATYSDSNSQNYLTTSNTLVVTVQNVPSLSLTGTGGTGAVPGASVTDTYTVSNTGNGPGYLQFSGGAVNGNCSVSTVQYTVIDQNHTIVGSNLSVDQVNNYLNGTYQLNGTKNTTVTPVTLAAGVTWTVQMIWTAPTGNCSGQYTTTLGATITQPDIAPHKDGSSSFNGEDAPAETSATVTANTTGKADNVGAEATLDLQDTVAVTTSTVTVTTTGDNSGSVPDHGLQSVATWLGASNPGIFVVQRAPVFNGSPLAVSGTPTFTTGTGIHVLSSQSATLYYGTTADATTWTKTAPTSGSVYYIGFFIPCGTSDAAYGSVANSCLDPNLGKSSAGNVPAAYTEFTIAASYVAPTGAGSGTANAIGSIIANGVAGGNQSNEQVMGPGITSSSSNYHDSDSTVRATEAVALTNVIDKDAPTGASNLLSTQEAATYGVFHGPLNNPEAVGSEDGNGAPDSNGDFTAYILNVGCGTGGNACPSVIDASFVPKGSVATTFQGAPVTVTAGTTVAIQNTIENKGNGNDTYLLSANIGGLNTGSTGPWSVAFYPVNGAGTGPAATAFANSTTPSVASGAKYTYYAVYTLASATPMNAFTPYKARVTAASTSDTTQKNDTYNEILVNGFIGVMKTLSVDNTNGCPATATYVSVAPQTSPQFPNCSGSVLNYTLTYFNRIPAGGSGNVYPTVNGSVVISDDGSSATGTTTLGTWVNNWAAYTTGLSTAPVDANGTITYTATSLTDTIAGSAIGPGTSGSVKYKLVVK